MSGPSENWLDQLDVVPPDWQVVPLRSFAAPGARTFTDGDWVETPFITDEGVRLVQTGNVGTGVYKEQGFRYISEDSFDQLGCTEVVPGDVLVCRLAAPVGRACLAPDLGTRMITSVDVSIVKPAADVDPRFLVYQLSSRPYLEWMNASSRGGTRDRVSRSMLGSVRVLKPSLRMQRLISDYLDSETARIDTLIDRKQRFIDLLLEKRTALITHAVIKGLDSNVEMKDSGAQWLGQVPAHWEVKPNKYLLRLHQRTVGETGAEHVLLSLTLKGLIRREMDGTGKWPSSFDTYQSVQTGELVFCLFDVDETPRTVGLAHEPGMVTGAYTVAECLPGSVARYVYYLFLSFDSDKRLKPLYSGLRKVIRPDRFLAAKMPAPSVAEQRAIVQYLDEQTATIDGLVDKTRRSVDLLREYRTALISAAVTGQIDIPGTETTEEVA